MSGHYVLADGYCETCHSVPCKGQRPSTSTAPGQLDRIEQKVNRILRALKVDESGDS